MALKMSLALASSIPVPDLEKVCPRKGWPWPRIFFVSLALASSLVSSTPHLWLLESNFRLGIPYCVGGSDTLTAGSSVGERFENLHVKLYQLSYKFTVENMKINLQQNFAVAA